MAMAAVVFRGLNGIFRTPSVWTSSAQLSAAEFFGAVDGQQLLAIEGSRAQVDRVALSTLGSHLVDMCPKQPKQPQQPQHPQQPQQPQQTNSTTTQQQNTTTQSGEAPCSRPKQQHNNDNPIWGRSVFFRDDALPPRGASTALWGVESCSLPSRWPNPIPATSPCVVRTLHLQEHRLQSKLLLLNPDTNAGSGIH